MKLLSLFACLLVLNPALAAGPDRLPGPVFEELGDLQFPVTTRSPKAQRYFNQGFALLYGFNHQEAIRSFRSAAFLDPGCAMAWWGVAYASGPHVNRPMNPEDTARAWEALQQAQARAASASPREQAYIRALGARYQPAHVDDRSALDRSFADAMRQLVNAYPDDIDARVLFAESLMNLMPWDYWQSSGVPKPEMVEAFDALRWVLSRAPENPGANHFYIHAVEAGPNPELGIPSADRLLRFAPAAGHLVHMPGHIYMRVGQYSDAIVANERAIKADETYIRRVRAQGFYPGVYYPHNIHFLWYAQLFEGRSREALRTADKAAQYALDNNCGPSKVMEAPRLRHLPWLTLARFGRWDEVLKVPRPVATNAFLVDRALWHFVRGLAFSGQGQLQHAEAEQAALSALLRDPAIKALDSPAFPVSSILAVADHWLAGAVAGAGGHWGQAVSELEKAVAAEDAIPYMEPAFWPVPTRPALGAMLLRANQPAQAAEVFRADLARFPRNGWGLQGLAESLRRQGKLEQADLVQRQFESAWAHSDVRLDLAWF